MAAEEETLARASREFVADMTTMLGGLHVPADSQNKYIDYLYSQNLSQLPDDEVNHAALAIGRLYFQSLTKRAATEPYTGGEQIMIGLITGRTIREKPMSLTAAANEFGMNYSDSALIKQSSLSLAFSGIKKLRQRTTKYQDLYTKTRIDLEDIHARLKSPASIGKQPPSASSKQTKSANKSKKTPAPQPGL